MKQSSEKSDKRHRDGNQQLGSVSCMFEPIILVGKLDASLLHEEFERVGIELADVARLVRITSVDIR